MIFIAQISGEKSDHIFMLQWFIHNRTYSCASTKCSPKVCEKWWKGKIFSINVFGTNITPHIILQILHFDTNCTPYISGSKMTRAQSNFFLNIYTGAGHITASLFCNDLLCLALLVQSVNGRLLDNCRVSSLPHDCVAYRTRLRDHLKAFAGVLS